MNSIEKREDLIRVFDGDPLWSQIEILNLQEQAFKDEKFLESIIWSVDYTTSQVSAILNVKSNQIIINLLNRHDLKDYIKVNQSNGNGYYSFNHIAIFQLKMILVLRDNGHQPIDIANLLGTITQISRGEGHKKNVLNENSLSQNIDLETIDEMVELKVQQTLEKFLPRMNEELLRYKNHYENSLLEVQIDNALTQWEVRMRSIVNQIDLFETQMEILSIQPSLKPNIFSKLLGLQNEVSENQITKLNVTLKEKIEQLVVEKKELDEEKTKLLTQQSELKKIEKPATLNLADN